MSLSAVGAIYEGMSGLQGQGSISSITGTLVSIPDQNNGSSILLTTTNQNSKEGTISFSKIHHDRPQSGCNASHIVSQIISPIICGKYIAYETFSEWY
jgi:hypothetical protein